MTLQVVWGIEGISVIMSNLNKYFDPQHQQKHYCELFSGMIGWIGEIHVIAIAIKQRCKEKVKRKSKQSV